MSNNKPKILFIPGTPHASKFYRMLLPAMQLQKEDYEVTDVFFNTVDPITLLADHDGTPIDLKKADIIIFQMVWHQALVQVIKKVKALNIKTFMDIDDNYYALPANNPAFNSFHSRTQLLKDKEDKLVFMRQRQQFKETFTRHGKKYVRDRKLEPTTNHALENLEEAMGLVDYLQVSTPELKDVYSKFNQNIVVLPNCIDMQNYESTPKPIKQPDELVTVGWYGTKTHVDDLQLLDGLIPDNVKFVLIGVEDLVKNEHLFNGVKNLDLRPPFGDIYNLPEAIADIDIGVCPLVDNQFNRGKSELKAIEFNAMGIPVICSDVAPYSRYIHDGFNGFLISKNKTKFWIRYLKYLIEDTRGREYMGRKALEFAQTKEISKNIHLWKEVYIK